MFLSFYKIKILHFFIITHIFFSAGFASEKTDSYFQQLLRENKVTPTNEQSYCYTDENGIHNGSNIDLQIRLASVTKLLTSLWAVEEKGPDYRYETKLFIKGSSLHIQGSFDPFMSNEKMFFLISQLNELGFNHFDEISYDKYVQIFPMAQAHTDPYPLITRDSNGKNLKNYFNTSTWSSVFKDEYKRLASLTRKNRFLENVDFSADTITFSENNPFLDKNGDLFPNVKTLTLASPPLYKYLKETNVKSNNYSSQTIFLDLGGEKKFEEFLSERFGLSADKIKLYNGNGLPSTRDGIRKDNYATCSIMLDLISALQESLERQGKKMEDLLAVPGADAGTFRNRLNSSDYRNTFVAKTGTLMHTSALAGAISTIKGFSFFGVFNQTTNIAGAKITQNEMIKSLIEEMGGPKVFDYKVEGFHSYDNSYSVKNFIPSSLEEEPDDFSSIESKLF